MVILNNTKQVHAFDVDGVITAPETLAEIVARRLNIDFEYDKHLTDYHVDKSLLNNGFITSKQDFNEPKFFDEIAEEYYLTSKVREGFITYYKQLLEEGHEVIFVTARKEKHKHLTLYFLEREGIIIDPQKVIHVGNPKYKQDILTQKFVTHFYEDNFKTASKYLRACTDGSRTAFILDTPYNRLESQYEALIRINGWQDLIK